MSGLFWNTITRDMRLVLREFFRSGIAEKFYLAGGTALSLQIGHRESIDLDPDPVLVKPVPWEAVKEYFIEQAKEIERSWLR